MKYFCKLILIAAVCMQSIGILFAVPADKRPVTVKQKNGTVLTFILQGDERVNWAKTLDGYTLIRNNEGDFVYAHKNADGQLVASSYLACDEQQRSKEVKNFLRGVDKDLRYSASQIQAFKQRWEVKETNVKEGQNLFPTTGTDSLLVILVGFSDLDFTLPASQFEAFCNEPNYKGTGSVHDYFSVNSGGKLDLAIRVVGPYKLDKPQAFYGNNPNESDGYFTFVKDAVRAAETNGVNFANFDNDNDGYVDNLCLVFAGFPESSSGNADEIWPHSSSIPNFAMFKANDKYIKRYSCSAEFNWPNYEIGNIGTFCHEFGHVLGLPDEYDTDYGNSGGEAVTVGRYSVMCEGSYNNDSKSPALWSAGQKISTGWLTDIDTLTVPQDSLLIHAQTGRADDKAYMIRFKENTNEFLLIEQRRKQGFDSHIPGEGLLIYHGQESKLAAWFNREHNNINVNPSDRGWYIETANGVLAMNDAAPFPGSSGIKFFCLNSPNQAKFVNGQPMNVAVTDIHYVNDSVMMFNFNSTQPFVYTEKITDVNKTDAFTAKGTVAYLGAGYQTKGIIYSLDENCPYDENYVIVDNNTDDSSSITAEIKNLTAGTRYYYRAFVAQDGKIILGNTESTVTNTGFGMVYTDNASDIQENSAVLNGNLAYTGEGDYTFIEKGFIYSDDAEAELDFDVQNTVTVSLPDSVKGKYSITVTSLEMAKTYYYRAYVKNTYGTYFGTRKSFVTKYPEITNNTVSDNQNVCLGVVPAELKGELPDGGFGNFTYKWQQRRKGDNWEEAAGVNDGQNYQPELLTDSTYFRRVVISDGRVENTSNTVLIDVRISRGGEVTTFNTTTINTGEILSLGLTHSRGDVVDWERNYNETGWQSLAKSNKDITEVLQEAGQYAYRAIVQIDQCEPDTAQPAAVTVLASSIYDANNTELLTINPNPANDGKFVINAKDMQANVLIITNAAGQVVYLEKNVSLNNKMITLNVESGTYFVTVISDNNVITNKLIINK